MATRKLTKNEILRMESRDCRADNWENIEVDEDFHPEYISDTSFSGKVKLGKFEKMFKLPGDIPKHSGIYHSHIHNCTVGNNVLITNVRGHISNYRIGDGTLISGVNDIYVEKETTFGNGVVVKTVNENGSRSITITDKLNSQLAYLNCIMKENGEWRKLIERLSLRRTQQTKSSVGTIGENVKIINCSTIKNVNMGDYTHAEQCSLLENGTIMSEKSASTYIGISVISKDFIIGVGSEINERANIYQCFIGEACHLSKGFFAQDSLFFANSFMENGEACSVFAGPYSVSHHKSTLLIAGVFSFMNAGSNSNQSNHMYKLGPIHEGIAERGVNLSSGSYILWPAKIGAFTIVKGRHYSNPDTSVMPFSYLIECGPSSILVPGANLNNIGLMRDMYKFPKRDKRKNLHKTDVVSFDLLSPYILQKTYQAVKILESLKEKKNEEDYYEYGHCKIKSSSLEKGILRYRRVMDIFFGEYLYRQAKEILSKKKEKRLTLSDLFWREPDPGLPLWIDLGGAFVEARRLQGIINGKDIESDSIEHLDDSIKKLCNEYEKDKMEWTYDALFKYKGLSLSTINVEDLKKIHSSWKSAVFEHEKNLLEDIREELSPRFGETMTIENIRTYIESDSLINSLYDDIKKQKEGISDLYGIIQGMIE